MALFEYMTEYEKFLILVLEEAPNPNVAAVMLQSYIAEHGPLSEECAAKARLVLAGY